MAVADKHTVASDVLREYAVDLSIPHEVEFTIVAPEPIDSDVVAAFLEKNGFAYSVVHLDHLFMAELTRTMIITEANGRPLSESTERLSIENGWDYEGWGASSYK